MTSTRIASVLLRLVGWVVLLASGTYLLVYLYRWEWNRALISGLFFVAAEVALASAAILRRLAALERRLDEAARSDAPPSSQEGGDGGPFAWLGGDRLSVFVPVLLGVGVILSAVAYVVERTASATAWSGGDAAERRLRRLARPHPPLVPSITDAAATMPVASVRFVQAAPSMPRAHRAVTSVVAVSAALLLLAAGIGVLAELTMYVPDSRPTTGSTTYELLVELREGGGDRTTIAQALWLSCRGNLIDSAWAEIRETSPETVTMLIEPRVARNDDRRFVGCLEDVTLDRVRVDVVSGVDRTGTEA
jgi:hypothetical protein